MKKVLITGATGFAGQHLADYLTSQNSYELFGTAHSKTSDTDKISLEQIDLTDYDKVRALIEKVKPDFIYHLAALSSPAKSYSEPTQVVLGNIGMQMNVFNAVKNTGLKNCRVLVVSSGDMYGLIDKDDLPVDEDTPMRPVNPYAVSKMTQDYLGLQYNFSYKMDIVRARAFNHTGPGQPPGFVIPAFAKQIAMIEKKQQEPVLKVGSLTAARDFTDVRDVVRAYTLLMENGKTGEAYNIGSGKSVTVEKMLNMLLSFSTIKIEIEEDPEKVRPIEIPDVYCDFSKLQRVTEWEPKIPIETTLKETLDYWRSVV